MVSDLPGPEAIGIDIGGTHIRAARISASGAVLAHDRVPSSPDPEKVLARCLALFDGLRGPQVVALGIGVPGQVDVTHGRVLSGGFVDMSSLDVVGLVAAATGLRPVLDNDAGMALRGEAACGAARGRASAVLLTIGTGIGGAVLDGGRVLRGAGVAGQLGHLVIDPEGRVCVCGRRGCVETVSSGTAFGILAAEAGLPPDTRVEDLLCSDDPGASAVLRAWAQPLRAAIDTLIATLCPEVVVIGGGLGAAALAALERFPPRPSWFSAPVIGAELGDDAGVVGAGLAALEAAAPAPGKRLVLVNGVPASGKSRVAEDLSAATGWPILSLDTVKNPFLREFEGGDRDFNRALGRASYAAIFALLREAPPDTIAIVDAWFGFQPADVLDRHLAGAGIGKTAQLWCTAPPETIGGRYAARIGSRPPGHPGLDYVPELVELAQRAAPLKEMPTLRVDTTTEVDIDAVVAWLAGVWPEVRSAGMS